MSRYNSSTAITTESGIRRRPTTIFPILPNNTQSDIYIRTTSIERLDKLAYKFYNDQTLWWVIATANAIGKGTLVIPPNTRLRIPGVQTVYDILREVNVTR